MKTSKNTIRITEVEYKRLLKDVEEIEKLIVAAQKSCEEIERLRGSAVCSSYKPHHVRMHITKKIRKSALG